MTNTKRKQKENKMAKNEIVRVSDDNNLVKIGGIGVQLNDDELLDLGSKIAVKFNKTLISTSIVKSATLEINGILKDDAVQIPLHSTSNNNDMGYTGSKVATDDLMKLNQKFKKDS
jgi:hypothetical protein